MRFCVIGAGAMGSLFGGRLAYAGFQVTLVDTWAEHVATIQNDGLILDTPTGRRSVRVAATRDPAKVSEVDAVIVFVDANATAEAGTVAAPMLAPDGVVLTLQNGIGNYEALAKAVEGRRVLAGLSYASAAVEGPGQVTQTHEGPTWLGERDGHRSARIARLSDAFDQAGLNPVVVDDIVAIIWDKWILNCAINAICAVTGLRQGEIPRTPELETLQDRILDELFAVTAARGVNHSDPHLREAIKKQCWKKFNKPSMLQHVEAGKRIEIDALNGAAVRLGRERQVPTPYNEAVAALAKGVEKASRQARLITPIDYEALEEEAAARPQDAPWRKAGANG